MKKITTLLAVIVAAIAMAMPAQAGLRIGPRVGVAVNSLHFNENIFDKEYRTGFTGGLQAELSLPLGICIDASVMYVRRNADAKSTDDQLESIDVTRDYIDIPVNLKWKFGILGLGKVVNPYLFTGPDFAFLTSRKAINDAWSNHNVDVAWNFGFGVELFSHLQVSAGYGLGITKLAHAAGATNSTTNSINGKNNFWTVTAAWLF